MKIQWKILLICLAIPLVGGGIAGWLSKDSMGTFEALNKPPLSPPGWLFPVVWTILYILMGVASYIILTSEAPEKEIDSAIRLYGWQLLFNVFWSFWFFNLEMYFFAFVWLLILWFLILATILSFRNISKVAAALMIPYLLWVTFAGYLNLAIALLN